MDKNSIVNEVSPSKTQELIKKGYLLLDIREKREVKNLAFYVPKIMYIPLSELVERYAEIPRDQKIIVVCQSGERSWRAVSYLQKRNFTNLKNMKRGLEKWIQKGFPIIGNPTSILENSSCESSNY